MIDRPHHLVSADDVDRSFLDRLFVLARDMEEVVVRQGGTDDLHGRVLATLFYEPSTRTRFSFEVAMLRLGGSVTGAENAREHSSGAKGETLEDTTRIVGGYVDGIVVRHYEEGAAARMAAVALVPIINAGDGPHEHPTQALLDLYTIERELGRSTVYASPWSAIWLTGAPSTHCAAWPRCTATWNSTSSRPRRRACAPTCWSSCRPTT